MNRLQFVYLYGLLEREPEKIEFDDVIELIDDNFEFTPTGFKNGTFYNQPGENNGSCKLLSFAKLQNLSERQTLGCFGAYYREDVLNAPDGENHQNIRQFMQHGWVGVQFDGEALQPKTT